MKMSKDQAKRHHPVCVNSYNKRDTLDWRCQCVILRECDAYYAAKNKRKEK